MSGDLWPWLAVAAMGALHGLNPATGWAFGACYAHAEGRAPTLRLLVPVAVGHGASLVTVAAAVPAALQLGLQFDPLLPQGVAAGLLFLLALRHFGFRAHRAPWQPAARTGLALWSFMIGTAHGAGWMLVPALASVCGSDLPAREITASGSLALGLAAVGVHMAAMLATTAAMAAFARRGVRAVWPGPRAERLRPVEQPASAGAA
jgi:hypothetical protein